MEIFSYSKLYLKMVGKCDFIEGSLLRKKLCTDDLKNEQLPNIIENNIQISITLSSIMGSIVKMN
jgi:hypothetical protein